MYRRFYRNDELLSNVLIAFSMLLLFGMLISWKLVGEDTFDAEMIVYLVFGSISFLLFVFTIILYLIHGRKPLIDIELDFKKREIRTFNGRFSYSFDDVLLYSYNTRHRQVRFQIKWKLIGFSIDEMQQKSEAITLEQLSALSETSVTVEPKKLYNYHLLSILVFMGFTVTYLILASTSQILIFNTYIPTYYVMALCILLSIGTTFLNLLRLKKLREKDSVLESLNQEENTTVSPAD